MSQAHLGNNAKVTKSIQISLKKFHHSKRLAYGPLFQCSLLRWEMHVYKARQYHDKTERKSGPGRNTILAINKAGVHAHPALSLSSLKKLLSLTTSTRLEVPALCCWHHFSAMIASVMPSAIRRSPGAVFWRSVKVRSSSSSSCSYNS